MAGPRITVALTPEAARNLDALHDRTGLSGTSIVNRALGLYEFIDAQARAGNDILIRDGDGAATLIRLL